MAAAAPRLAARAVSKSFGLVEVLTSIDLRLEQGQVHALIGENGAGKSTLMKILCGYEQPSKGEVVLDGAPVHFADSAQAERGGVVLIHQEFNLAEQLSVEANIFLGRELRRGMLLDEKQMRARATLLLGELETAVGPRQLVSELSVPDKQMVEIAKALMRDARVLVMDEPTAVLTARESEVLFRQIARLRAQGVAILYTSHKLEEVKAIADVVTILRDGKHVITAPVAELTVDQMATYMVGRDVSDLFPAKSELADAPVVLEVDKLSVPGRVAEASFTLRRGEVLGFAGLVGAGRTELMEGLVGLRPAHGGVTLNGKAVHIHALGDAAKLGLAYLTEDRKGHGLLLNQKMRPNLTLLGLDRFSRGLIDEGAEDRALDLAIGEFDIRAPSRGQRRQPLGRQPAEALAGQDHAGRARDRHHRRTDPGYRYRHQAADLRLHRPAGTLGQERHRHLFRNGGSDWPLPPRLRHEGGADRRRTGRFGDQRGTDRPLPDGH